MNDTINIAVATDTILYTPFFLALYGGDFEDTPYGKLDVNIIGQKDNNSFIFDGKPSKNADGFVTLALFFGYADIGICDPSFIIQLCESNNTIVLKTALNEFANSLNPKEKIRFLNKLMRQNLYNNSSFKLNEIQKRLKDNIPIKVIGGIIKRNAFVVVSNKNSKFKKNQLFEAKPLYIFNKPSTGYYYGSCYKEMEKEQIDFGDEFSKVIENVDACALTCDYIAKDFYEASGKIKDVRTKIEKNETYLFTGILADVHQRNIEVEIEKNGEKSKDFIKEEIIEYRSRLNKYKAFSYAIEKNLFQIHKILKNEHPNSLNVYFQNKFFNSKSSIFYKNQKEIVKFLTSDKNVEDNLLFYIKPDGTKIEKSKDEIKDEVNKFIMNYVELLSEWFDSNEGLYYKSSKVNTNDLFSICQYRFSEEQQQKLKLVLPHYIDNNFTQDWTNTQNQINKHSEKKYFKAVLDKNLIMIFSLVFALSSFLSLILQTFNLNFFSIKSEYRIDESFEKMIEINKNDRWALYIFLIISIVVGFAIFFNKKFSKLEILKKYVFNKSLTD